MADEKECTRCKRILPVDKFGWRTQPSGRKYLKSHCRNCESQYRSNRYAEQKTAKPSKQPKPVLAEKLCRKCEKTLPTDSFYVVDKTKSRQVRRSVCIPCHNAGNKGHRQRVKSPDYKQCNTCKRWQALDRFAKAASGNPRNKCKDCNTAEAKQRDRDKKAAAGIADSTNDRADAEYDYKFARTMLGLSKFAALDWIARGYRNQDEATVYDWGFHLQETETGWEPDALHEYEGQPEVHPSAKPLR
ncbi:hypothetical protein [Nocardia jiangxiensis]|uniref:hypothetical protein n=1 Tax=Nocardia jiangxiensis TaxID=282685 RepID=UPI0002DA1808|nr:hypothetical protein [Nocardia jiangxiensis]